MHTLKTIFKIKFMPKKIKCSNVFFLFFFFMDKIKWTYIFFMPETENALMLLLLFLKQRHLIFLIHFSEKKIMILCQFAALINVS